MCLPPADLLRAVLCGCEPVLSPAHILREGDRHVQGQEAPRHAPARLCHHKQTILFFGCESLINSYGNEQIRTFPGLKTR